MATEIRQATHDDLPAILILAEQLYTESPHFSRFTFSYEKAANLLHQLVDSPIGCVLIAVKDGDTVGMLVAMVIEHLVSTDKMATDLGFFVDPAHRGSTIGVRLIKAFEAWANEKGIVELTLEVNTEVEAARTVGLLERQGYYLSGYRLVKPVRG